MFVCGRKAALSRQTVENFSLPGSEAGKEYSSRTPPERLVPLDAGRNAYLVILT